MRLPLDPFRLLLISLAGWLNQQQQDIIDYLHEENRVLREQLGSKRLRFPGSDSEEIDGYEFVDVGVEEDLPGEVQSPEPMPESLAKRNQPMGNEEVNSFGTGTTTITVLLHSPVVAYRPVGVRLALTDLF